MSTHLYEMNFGNGLQLFLYTAQPKAKSDPTSIQSP